MKLKSLFSRNKETKSQRDVLISLFEKYNVSCTNVDEEVELEFLIDLVEVYRPENIEWAKVNEINLGTLLDLLEENEAYRTIFKSSVVQLIGKRDMDQIITDAGIIKDADFLHEVRLRTFEKIIPPQSKKDSLQYVLNQLFYLNTDPIWIKSIPTDQIYALYEICSFRSIYKEGIDNFVISELEYAIEVLVNRMVGRAMETSINKMVPEFQNFKSPFLSFQREMADLNERLMLSEVKYIRSTDAEYIRLTNYHEQCVQYVDQAFENAHHYGISMSVNQSLLRIRQQLERVKEMLPFLVLDDDSLRTKQTVLFAELLISYNCNKSNIRKLISDSTQLISYEVTQHTAQTGEKYITRTRGEYFKMLYTAGGGGIIVAFLCIFKVLLAKADLSDLGHAFAYSMNYSIGFIAIYLCSFTLATKQPAMTASALITALEKGQGAHGKEREDAYRAFAIFFARVFRSQFIAFIGNVFLAFPVALFLIWGIDKLFDYNIAATKWEKLIVDLSPVHSKAIFHAAIAGCFLFISGIIAGSIANRDKYEGIYYRLQEHPRLKKAFGKEKTKKIAAFYEKRWAGIVSNFWFGIFMGSTVIIGAFIGLDLDIRHITFASGNLALGLYGNDFHVPLNMIVWGVIGVGVIGFVNFIVSFTLSLILAFRSRNISIMELSLVGRSIWRFFKSKPYYFFFPPRREA